MVHLKLDFLRQLNCRNLKQLRRTFIDIRRQDIYVKAWSTWRRLPKLSAKTTKAQTTYTCLKAPQTTYAGVAFETMLLVSLFHKVTIMVLMVPV